MRQQATRLSILAALFAIASTGAGCLVKETSVTLCLEPDGSGRWAVLERGIHATGESPAERQREEDAFMTAAAVNQHPAAIAFRSLGGTDVRGDVVSSQWPFAVQTEARFPDIARAWQRVLDTLGLHGQSVLERNGARTTWKVVIDNDPDDDNAPPDGESGADYAVLLGDAGPTVVLRHGQFVEAVGFDIADDGRVARMKNLNDHDWEKEPRIALSLTWVNAEAVSAPQK